MNDKIVHGRRGSVKRPRPRPIDVRGRPATWDILRSFPAGRSAAAAPRTETVVIRIGINGLGRIGRGFLRLALERDDLEVVAVNDLAEPGILAHLVRHDSLAGRRDVGGAAPGGAVGAEGDQTFGVERAAMTTVHCYTTDQVLMDAPPRAPRRARAAGLSMIPTSTTAAAAIARVMPALAGKVRCLAVRVPTAAVSLIDLSIVLRRPTGLEEVRAAFRDAALGRLRGILGYGDEELVSIDYLGDTRSAVIDAPLLALDGGTFLKVFAWYDNERGYVHRLADLLRHMQGSEPPGRLSP